MDWNFGMESRINGADASRSEAISKAMNDRAPNSGKNKTKVGQRIRNGSHWSCVGKDQDDFSSVEQANIGTSKMDNKMESNDGQEMDQEWNQVFAMMEQVEVSDFVVKPSLEAHLCNRPIKGATQSYYRLPKSHKSRKSNHVSNVGTHNRVERNEVSDFDIKPCFEALLCKRSFKRLGLIMFKGVDIKYG